MATQAYKATAEILSAYDDEIIGTAAGFIEIDRCPECGHTTVTAAFYGHTAEAAGTAHRVKEIYDLVEEATHRAAIETAGGSGIQLGFIYLEEEIPGARPGIVSEICDAA